MSFSDAPLTSGCQVCGRQVKLLRCAGCNVVQYCDKEHQVSDWPPHKLICSGVKKARTGIARQEQKLRDHPGDMFMPTNVLEDEASIGHFWGLHETRPYMRARFALVEALLKFKTREAVQEALNLVMETFRLNRSDNMGIRDLAPALLLRLGRDQECYDFVKWWTTINDNPQYDWGNTSLPYLDTKNADVLEPTDLFTRKYSAELNHLVAIALLKVRLLLDLKALQNSGLVGEKMPQELLDNVRERLVGPILAARKDIVEKKDVRPLISDLEAQVKAMYAAVQHANKHFWPALLKPGANLTARPEYTSHGDPMEMQLALQYYYNAWSETPGAVQMMREMVGSNR